MFQVCGNVSWVKTLQPQAGTFSYHSYLSFTPSVDEDGALHVNPVCSTPSAIMRSGAVGTEGFK